LTDQLHGPILQPLKAYHDIAFACVTYLVTAFELVDPSKCTFNPMVRVGEGFHSLQLYANTFWLDHVLDYVTLKSHSDANNNVVLTSGSCANTQLPIAKQLSTLSELYLPQSAEKEPRVDIVTIKHKDKRLQSL
jgi:hypothetical protein